MSMHHAKNLNDHVGYQSKHILILSCQLELK